MTAEEGKLKTIIVSGGNIEDDFALCFLRKTKYDYLIAADKGMEFLKRAKLVPDEIVGDFDSADKNAADFFRNGLAGEARPKIRQFCPQKDYTDMEIAMQTALERASTEIVVLGATGTRIDHVLGSIRNLSIPMRAGVPCCIVDSHNRIRMTERSLTISREEQYGKYVSLLAHGGDVTKLTLEGFFYPLDDYTLHADQALGISNEITAEEGHIIFESGCLLVIESRD